MFNKEINENNVLRNPDVEEDYLYPLLVITDCIWNYDMGVNLYIMCETSTIVNEVKSILKRYCELYNLLSNTTNLSTDNYLIHYGDLNLEEIDDLYLNPYRLKDHIQLLGYVHPSKSIVLKPCFLVRDCDTFWLTIECKHHIERMKFDLAELQKSK